MTDTELDQVLDRWEAPLPSPGLRARVLRNVPQPERRRGVRPLRWVLAIAVASCLLAIGMGQTGHTAVENLAGQLHTYRERLGRLANQLWVGHILAAFRDSHLKFYVDGELRADATFGGSGEGWWLRTPGEGKYYLTLSRFVFEGPVPPRAGRFDGHVLEFQSGGRVVRIESDDTFGFGLERLPVYVVGLRADR
jgi:hypothetical protein